MSIYKETAIAMPALAMLLFVSHTLFGPDESYRHLTTNPKSWLGGVGIPAERFIARRCSPVVPMKILPRQGKRVSAILRLKLA